MNVCIAVALAAAVLAALAGPALACTNMLVDPAASTDGSAIVAYNADSATVYGMLYHYPAADHEPNATRDIYNWDSGAYLGSIPEAAHTYNVVGNTNEYGLVIGETTFGGISLLGAQAAAKVDYGAVIWVTLQRARTAREAIAIMGQLVKDYGYGSEGESFSIGDPNEVWIMEMISKGEVELGAVWVAVRVPSGCVSAHANQARIRTFPLNDPDNAIYAPDVISFARNLSLFNGTDTEFSFSDTYDPVSFTGARFCESRVWNFFKSVMGEAWAAPYLGYAQGLDLKNRMPLWVCPANKVSPLDIMQYMRSHFEGSWFDMSGPNGTDVGASFDNKPYRWRPLTWTSKGANYVHERAIGTPQTGWNFVWQGRRWVPRQMASLFWFGVDDSATTVRTPVYGGASRVPLAFSGKGPQDGATPPMLKFDMGSAFWAFNLVANWAYSNWAYIYPDVLAAINSRETNYMEEVSQVDAQAIKLFSSDPDAAVELLTRYGETTGNQLVADWGVFFGQLFVKFRDGYVITPSDSKVCGCAVGSTTFPQTWYDRIASDTGSRYKFPSSHTAETNANPLLQPRDKLQLKALQ